MYYLRTRPAANPIQFTVDKKRLAASRALNQTNGTQANTSVNKSNVTNGAANGEGDFSVNDVNTTQPSAESSTIDLEQQMAALVCSLENKDDCMMCGA